MVEDLVREFEARFPWLSSWFGDRLDIELPAFLVSLTVHGLLLISLAFVGYRVHKEVRGNEFKSAVVDNLVTSESTFQDLDQSINPPPLEAAAGSFAPTLATTITSAPSSTGAIPVSTASADTTHGMAPELVKLDVRRATEVVVPTATMLGQTVSIRGNGAEMVGGVEGAVDRIAIEIVRRLEQGRTLVVWAFDASGSLQAERQRLGKHIETIYTHINQLDESHLSSDNGLLTMVVAFGHDHRALLPKPTADRSEIIEAIKSVPLDETGIETTFTTVADIVHHWGRYKDAHNQIYRTMVIVVTDEVGDDEERLEDAIAGAQKAKVPVYVLGSQAIFGRKYNYVDYVEPKTKHLFRNVQVRQGPKAWLSNRSDCRSGTVVPSTRSSRPALGRMPSAVWPQPPAGSISSPGSTLAAWGLIPPGCGSTGPTGYGATSTRKRSIARHCDRRSSPPRRSPSKSCRECPPCTFPAADGPEFKEAMANNQAVAERTAYTVDEALGPINAVVKLRDREKSRRWQAHYDLIRGRLLAMKVRCYEYNWACALMKKDPPKFSNAKSNAWRLVPDQAIRYSDKAVAAGREAESLLHRVVEDHPATPWALLAQRELENPLGFKWVETYVSPRPRTNDAEAAKRKNKNMNQPKPPEMPKL